MTTPVKVTRCLLDSNILLRLGSTPLQQISDARKAVGALTIENVAVFYTSQNIGEFWSVRTRPMSANGHASDIMETELQARAFEAAFTLLPDSEETHRVWRDLLLKHKVRGKQVHDARLVAAMLVHRVPHILTLDVGDFRRFTEISVLHPSQFASPEPQ